MALIEKPEDTESDDQKAGTELDRAPPFDQGEEQREGENDQKHGQQVACP